MSKWVKEKNKRLRESDDFVPFEIYKATRPKTKSVKDRGRLAHNSTDDGTYRKTKLKKGNE